MADGSFRRSLNAPYEHRRPLERLMVSLSNHEARGAPLSPRSSWRKSGSRADGEACSDLELQACSRRATVPGSWLSSGWAVV